MELVVVTGTTRKGTVMYIMRRSGHVQGLAGIATAVEATHVVQNAGMPVSLWVAGAGAVPGSVAWSVIVDSFAQYAGYTERLMSDATYADFVATHAGEIVLSQPDTLAQVVHGEVSGPAEVGEYIGSLEAVVHPDRGAEAWAFAIEVADAFAATTGLPTAVVKNTAGDQATVGWLARYGSAEAVDEAEAATAASADYAAVLAKAHGLFTAGNQLFARRAA